MPTPKTDFECRYIATSGIAKQFKLDFDKCIDFMKKQLRVAYFNAKKELLFYKQFFSFLPTVIIFSIIIIFWVS